jgi:hypothetical protein
MNTAIEDTDLIVLFSEKANCTQIAHIHHQADPKGVSLSTMVNP